MMTTSLRPRDVPRVRQDLVEWSCSNVRPDRDAGGVRVHGFDRGMIAAAARSADLYYVNDRMTRLAREIGDGLPVCAFDAADLLTETGFLVWSDDPSPQTPSLGQPRAVLWHRVWSSLRVMVLDDAGPYRREIERLGSRADPAWARTVRDTMAGQLVVGFGAALPLGDERPWERMKSSWEIDPQGRPVRDRYQAGRQRLRDLNADQIRVLRTLLGTLLLIRQPADSRKSLHQAEDLVPDAATRKRLRRSGADQPEAPVRYYTLRESIRPDEQEHPHETATRIYRHRWFVRPHRRTYPDPDDPSGKARKWVGPYLVVPAGCEDAPILGIDRVYVLRR